MMNAMATTKGRLIQKTQRQEMTSVKKPPTSGPREMNVPPVMVWMPNARPRCSAGNTCVIIATEVGKMMAAPMP